MDLLIVADVHVENKCFYIKIFLYNLFNIVGIEFI